MKTMDDFNFSGKNVLLRLDLNSPLDLVNKSIINDEKIDMCIPTLKELVKKNAKVAIISNQGDINDYNNLIPLAIHAKRLMQKSKIKIKYVDDICGLGANYLAKTLKSGEVIILGNLSYLIEESSVFEQKIVNETIDTTQSYMLRSFKSIFNIYVNEAFSIADRNVPSMTGFQKQIPSCVGRYLQREVESLNRILDEKNGSTVFLIGGMKVSEAVRTINGVLKECRERKVLLSGLIANVMYMAKGIDIGSKNIKFLKDRNLDKHIDEAINCLKDFEEQIILPLDFAIENNFEREEFDVSEFPKDALIMDIGQKTIEKYSKLVLDASNVFIKGTMGIFENIIFERGTREVFRTLERCKAYRIIAGKDTLNAARSYIKGFKIEHISSSSKNAMNYLAGQKLPLLEAINKAEEESYFY